MAYVLYLKTRADRGNWCYFWNQQVKYTQKQV